MGRNNEKYVKNYGKSVLGSFLYFADDNNERSAVLNPSFNNFFIDLISIFHFILCVHTTYLYTYYPCIPTQLRFYNKKFEKYSSRKCVVRIFFHTFRSREEKLILSKKSDLNS